VYYSNIISLLARKGVIKDTGLILKGLAKTNKEES